MKRELNRHTQPFRTYPVFNNWDVVAEAWYIAAPSRALKRRAVLSMTLCGQRIVLFRGDDDKVRALDAFCPHMGTDLGLGRVVENSVRCFFHHWRFDGSGACVDVPCGEPIPKQARLRAYAVQEKYGYLWVYPRADPPADVPDFPELAGDDLVTAAGRAFFRPCHHHVNMINGIDPQHLKTVHSIDIDMRLTVDEDPHARRIDFVLRGEIPKRTFKERLTRFLLGAEYCYGMRYDHASIGLLSILKDARLFGRLKLPALHMLYAYRPVAPGKTEVQPIYVTRRRKGPLGWLLARALLLGMVVAYGVLRDEDGAIYDNIRFHPKNLLKMDAPIARFIGWVNRLQPSVWSKSLAPNADALLAHTGPDDDGVPAKLSVVQSS